MVSRACFEGPVAMLTGDGGADAAHEAIFWGLYHS